MTFFFNNEILYSVQFWPKCGKQMSLEINLNYMDEKVLRFRSKIIDYDTKKSLRKKWVFEFINIPLPIIYLLTFNGLLKNILKRTFHWSKQ